MQGSNLTVHIPCTQTALEASEFSQGVPSAAIGSRIAKKFCSAERHTSWQGVTPFTMKF